jgi:hypothetical protein
MDWRGQSRRGEVGQGKGTSVQWWRLLRIVKAWSGPVRQGQARQGMAGQGMDFQFQKG